MVLPGSSDPRLGSGKWSAGPTIVVLRLTGGFTFGVLANQVWSFAGDDFTGGAARSPVSAMFLQPFLSYTTPTAVTIQATSETSANWRADEVWTVPLILNVSKVTRFGPFPFSVQLGVGTFVAAPDGQPDWRFRIAYTVLLPRK